MAFCYEISAPTALRTFARTLTLLLRIGDELYVEPTTTHLALRLLNSGRSAHLVVHLQGRFFEKQEGPQACQTLPNYKVSIRSLLNVFKSVHTIQSAALQLQPGQDHITITLECLHNIRKVYRLTYEDLDSPKAQHTPDPNCCCSFQADPRQMSDLLGNLSAKVDKVTFTPEAARLRLCSYAETETTSTQLQTECSVDTRDLAQYRCITSGPLFTKTFQLKEFKALVTFCDAGALPLHISFGRGNEPIVCETRASDGSDSFWAQLLVAAFDELDDAVPTVQTPEPPAGERTPVRGSQAPSIRSFNSPASKADRTPTTATTTTTTTAASEAMQHVPLPPNALAQQSSVHEIQQAPVMDIGDASPVYHHPEAHLMAQLPPSPPPPLPPPPPPPPFVAQAHVTTALPVPSPIQQVPIPMDWEVQETPIKRPRHDRSSLGSVDHVSASSRESAVCRTPLTTSPAHLTSGEAISPLHMVPHYAIGVPVNEAIMNPMAPPSQQVPQGEVYDMDADPPHRYESLHPMSWEEMEEDDRGQDYIEPSPSPPRP